MASEAPVQTIADDVAALQLHQEQEEKAPAAEHACAYCGIDDVNCVMKCTTCNKWFCNGYGHTNTAHIVAHLVRSRHRSVMLHPASPLGDTVPECYSCGSRNPFLLGFLPAKGDAVVMLLCRSPCNFAANTKGIDWDATQWSPLIENRSFLSWLVKVPSSEQQKRARHITPKQISTLEDLWRENERATIEDVENPQLEHELPKTQLQYESPTQYKDIFRKLISVEEVYNKRMIENLTQHDISVQWETSNGELLVWIRLPQLESGEIRLTLGDELILRYTGTLQAAWEERVTVVQFSPTSSMEVACVVPPGKGPAPTECTTNFMLEFVWLGTTFERMNAALARFARKAPCMDASIQKALLGNLSDVAAPRARQSKAFDPTKAPGLPDLNHSQVAAIRSVFDSKLSLIQGPPGTGKTVTSATLIFHLVRRKKAKKVLVCAPSNVAVDHLAQKLHMAGLRVLRVVSRFRETFGSEVAFLSLHEQSRLVNGTPELNRLIELKQKQTHLSQQQETRYRTLMYKHERKLTDAAEVICTTCSNAADRRLNDYKFSTVLIDEATQATEPECLIPIVKHCEKLILVGDHQQLGPVVMNRKVAKSGMNQSMFERLVLLGIKPRRLEVQYRMHPALSEFPSNMFYDGMLQNGVSAQERLRAHVALPWPVPTVPMMFYQNLGQEEMSSSGTSHLNRTEAASVEKLVSTLLKAGVVPEQIGVITPYEGQRNFIINHMQFHGSMMKDAYRAVEVANVDAFQGREKDYIIVSCVRSNNQRNLGFLKDSRRLNVAITRARYGLIVIGNARALCSDPLWYHFLMHFKDRNLLVEGALTNLRPSMIRFAPPKQVLEHAKTEGPAANDSLAMDPVRAPFWNTMAQPEHTREGMWSTLSLDVRSLSHTQSDKLHRAGNEDDSDAESLDGYRSQASVADSLEDDGRDATPTVLSFPNIPPTQPSMTNFL